ncbi:hypothetical protein LL037_18105 [Clostridium estertheticum]|uniref:DUF2178 domain-containing protein n=1 Tax=Clostridium estertheticum TaxID=238834 RepID=A0AA47EJU0_9CLOT|nr:hypothetical protein [Clostridium estertheticum]MBU3153713.1 hypothetical protein [Clostridium estertheticum]MBU3200197.1 hypothetical protein [Clostridium estertheticum]WAG61501.1 hypothetical protein LL038_04415 [Clostridium estertheticum]WAG64371.1 hypothetical protein LL037_18105 [Clostridium estertheticum]
MKKKIYNKKKFWSGIVFLLLTAISISDTITRFNNLNALRITKYILLDTFGILFGVTEVCRSLSSKCTKEDNQNDDERVKLVKIKSKASAFNFTLGVCFTIVILSMIAWGVTKNDAVLGILICFIIIITIMMFAEIGSYFYHEKRN